MQEGYHRKIETQVSCCISFFLVLIFLNVSSFLYKEDLLTNEREIVAYALQLMGVMSALLTTVVFTIRNKSVDYYVRFLPDQIQTHDPVKTSIRLTNLFLLSFSATIVQLTTSVFVESNFIFATIMVSLSIALGIACSIQYLYALFALEYLEIVIINAQRKKVEVDQQKNADSITHDYAQIPKEWNR